MQHRVYLECMVNSAFCRRVQDTENRTTSKCRMDYAEGSKVNRKLSKPLMYTDDYRLDY